MRRVLIPLLLIAVVAGGLIAWRYYSWIYRPNTPATLEHTFIYVPHGSTLASLTDSLVSNGYIANPKSFAWVGRRMQFTDASVKPGRYRIVPATNNRALINQLRLGQQEPLNMRVRPALTIGRMASDLGRQIELDSAEIVTYVMGDYLARSSYDTNSIMTLFVPNTYEVYWNMTVEDLLERLERERDAFWTESRRQRASELGLTTHEVHTLASIVERETYFDKERAIISGLYLNRLKKNMLLQADPTVLFALGDHSIKRVLYRHLEVDSPYNTYKHRGLPPGPIAIPSIKSLLATLNPDDHSYLFFCLKPGADGHAFAATLADHNRNARAYHRWLDTRDVN